MYCPFCSAINTKLIDSHIIDDRYSIRRRFLFCNERFTTFEITELVMPQVVKSNDICELFNESKLRKRNA